MLFRSGSRTWYLLPQVVNTEEGPVTFGYYAFNSAQQLEDHVADVEILLLGRAVIFGAVAMADARLSARSMCLRPGYQRGFPRIKAPTSAPERLLALRQQYIDGVKGLSSKVSGMRKAGLSPEQIARSLQAQRRALGEQFKNVTDPKLLEQIYQRNLAKYGDKLGPSIDWLRARGKTWEQIIDSASRPGGGDLGF